MTHIGGYVTGCIFGQSTYEMPSASSLEKALKNIPLRYFTLARFVLTTDCKTISNGQTRMLFSLFTLG